MGNGIVWGTAGVGVALGLMGCSSGPSHDDDVAALDWRLAELEYPFTGDHGEMVCAEWRRAMGDGTMQVEREYYHPNVMNRQLDDARTPSGSRHVSEAHRLALEEKGISRVATCDEAREFIRSKYELIEAQPSMEGEPPAEYGWLDSDSMDALGFPHGCGSRWSGSRHLDWLRRE